MTGLLVSHLISEEIIFPGADPKYVRRCPISSEESLRPPKLILVNFLFRAVAMVLAILVLPIPGAPTKQIMGFSKSGLFFFKTAYSIILFLRLLGHNGSYQVLF